MVNDSMNICPGTPFAIFRGMMFGMTAGLSFIAWRTNSWNWATALIPAALYMVHNDYGYVFAKVIPVRWRHK